jgi:hypothetical protein
VAEAAEEAAVAAALPEAAEDTVSKQNNEKGTGFFYEKPGISLFLREFRDDKIME